MPLPDSPLHSPRKEVPMTQRNLLYTQIYDYLRQLIEENKNEPDFRLPSENELASRFKASRISAKHALDLLLEEGLIYRQQGRGTFIAPLARTAAVSLRSPENQQNFLSSRNTVAVIVPFLHTSFMCDLIAGIRETLESRNLECYIMVTDNDKKKEALCLQTAQVHCCGIILFPIAFTQYSEEMLQLTVNHFPLVQVDRYLHGLPLSYVGCDQEAATRRGVEMLYQQGHRRISFIGHLAQHSTSVSDRCHGFDKATLAFDPGYPASFKLSIPPDAPDLEQRLDAHIREMNPTAIISSSRSYAKALMRYLKDSGLENAITLMLYDNEFSLGEPYLSPRPYIIDQQPKNVGAAAANLLYRLAFENGKTERICLPADIFQL